MGQRIIGLFVIVAGGVMLADLIAHPAGTNAVFNGVSTVWKTSVNGLLGKASRPWPD